MAASIFVRETDALLSTARQALPATAPQLLFALAMLGVGVTLGRVTRRAGSDPLADRAFTDGAGI